MSENILITNYTKAINDLSGKVFISGFIASIWVEFGPFLQQYFDTGAVGLYLIVLVLGFLGSSLILSLIGYLDSIISEINLAPVIGVSIMPIGFAILVPDYFGDLKISIHKVSGVAILAWSFMLLELNLFEK